MALAATGMVAAAVRALSPQRQARPPADEATAAAPARPLEAGAAPTAPAAQGQATGPPPKQAPKLGTFGQRWRDRSSWETVKADMAFGCCANRCVGKLLTDRVVDGRTEQSKHGPDARRLRCARSWRITRNLRQDWVYSSYGGRNCERTLRLCPTAFDVLRGCGKGYTYAYLVYLRWEGWCRARRRNAWRWQGERGSS